ncbi:Pleiotropic drug resistance protein abc superfamily, partial [Globisporangium polare]
MADAQEKIKDDEVAEHVAATDIVADGNGVAAVPSRSTDPAAARVRFDSNESAMEEACDKVTDLQDTVKPETRLKSMMLERYSSFDVSNVDSLMSGGFDRFLGKLKSVRREYNLTFPTPEIHFEDLS